MKRIGFVLAALACFASAADAPSGAPSGMARQTNGSAGVIHWTFAEVKAFESKLNQDPKTSAQNPVLTIVNVTEKETVRRTSFGKSGEAEIHGNVTDVFTILISPGTILKIERESGRQVDIRRFRPNIVIETKRNEPFEEDNWVGKTIIFGKEADDPAVSVTLRDVRCVMINLDPETAQADPAVMKSVVRLNQNNAGVYGTVIRTGSLSVGQKVYWGKETPPK